MKNLILKLKALLPSEDFIVTGSFALNQFGISAPSNDLDIILSKPDVSTIETINRLMKEFPAKTTIKKPLEKLSEEDKESSVKKNTVKKKPTPDCSAIFMYDNVKVDVFIEDKYTRPFILLDGIKYSTIQSIIDAKKSYGRMKDWLQLRDMARLFFKQEEFDLMLNTSWKNTMNNAY